MRIESTSRIPALAAALLLALGLACAGERRVRITLSDGAVLEGTLKDFEERTYRLQTPKGLREIAEHDVARVEFVGPKPPKDTSPPGLLREALAAAKAKDDLAGVLGAHHYRCLERTTDHEGRRRDEHYLVRTKGTLGEDGGLELVADVLPKEGSSPQLLDADQNVPYRLSYRIGPDGRVQRYAIASAKMRLSAKVDGAGKLHGVYERFDRGRKVTLTPRWDPDAIPELLTYFVWGPLAAYLPPHVSLREAPPKKCDPAHRVTVMRLLAGLEDHASGALVRVVSRRKRERGKYRDGATTIEVAASRLQEGQRAGQVLGFTFREEGRLITGERVSETEFTRLRKEWQLGDPGSAKPAQRPPVEVPRTAFHEALRLALAKDAPARVKAALSGTRRFLLRPAKPTPQGRDPDLLDAYELRCEPEGDGVRFRLRVERPLGSALRTQLDYVYGPDGQLAAFTSVDEDGHERTTVKGEIRTGYLEGSYERELAGKRDARTFSAPWEGHAPETLVRLVLPVLLSADTKPFELRTLLDLEGFPYLASFGKVFASAPTYFRMHTLPAGAKRFSHRGATIALLPGTTHLLLRRDREISEPPFFAPSEVVENTLAAFCGPEGLLGLGADSRARRTQPAARYASFLLPADAAQIEALRRDAKVRAAAGAFAAKHARVRVTWILAKLQDFQRAFRAGDRERDGKRDFASTLEELGRGHSDFPAREVYGYRIELLPVKDLERSFRLRAAPISGKGPHLLATPEGVFLSEEPLKLGPADPVPAGLKKL